MVAEGDAPPEAAVDGRLEWLQGWVALKLSVKPDKFKKLAASADAAAPIHHFLSNPDCRRLVVLGKDKDNKELTCAELPPPTGLKRRAVYFLKLERQALTAETMDTLVAPGDLLPDTLSQLHTLCETAYLPLLSNGDNSPGWPPQLVSDLTEGLTRLSALVYVTLGQAQGRTLLPLPPETSAAERRMVERDLARDKERVHSFEAAVVTWTRQIKVRAPTARSYGGSPATGWCPARARMAPRPRRMEFATRTPKPSVAARLASQRQIVHVPAVCVRAHVCVRVFCVPVCVLRVMCLYACACACVCDYCRQRSRVTQRVRWRRVASRWRTLAHFTSSHSGGSVRTTSPRYSRSCKARASGAPFAFSSSRTPHTAPRLRDWRPT